MISINRIQIFELHNHNPQKIESSVEYKEIEEVGANNKKNKRRRVREEGDNRESTLIDNNHLQQLNIAILVNIIYVISLVALIVQCVYVISWDNSYLNVSLSEAEYNIQTKIKPIALARTVCRKRIRMTLNVLRIAPSKQRAFKSLNILINSTHIE